MSGIRGSATFAGVSAEVRTRLRGSIETISRAAGIGEEVVARHLDNALANALEHFSARYVSEMGEAIKHVGELREVVHRYYESAFRHRLNTVETAELRAALDRLRDTTRELVPPDVWALHQLQRPREPGAAAEPVTPQQAWEDLFAHQESFEAPRPAGEPVSPAVAPRWATRGMRQRLDALPVPARLGLERAAALLDQSTIDDALTGKPGSVAAMYRDLKGLLQPDELRQALDAVALVRQPGVAYALGGGLGGSRPPVDHVQAAYQALPPVERAAFDRAAAADPEFVRAMATAETHPREANGISVPWRPEEMTGFRARHGFGAAEGGALERALVKVNGGHETGRFDVELGIGSTRDARSRAAQLDHQLAALGLPADGVIAQQLRSSPLLRDLGTRDPDTLLDLAGRWLARQETAGKKPLSLEEYVLVQMETNQRGLAGEFGAVFQLGKLGERGERVLVLKAPGVDVNVRGTDFIVVVPSTGEIWFGDNKTLSQAGLGEVTSLVEKFGENLKDDTAQLKKSLAGLDPALPGASTARAALERIAMADAEVGKVLAQLAREKDFARLSAKEIAKAIAAPEVQREITAILDRPDIGIRRAITNAGGDLAYLQQRLTDRGIDLADLRLRSAEVLEEMKKQRAGRGTP